MTFYNILPGVSQVRLEVKPVTLENRSFYPWCIYSVISHHMYIQTLYLSQKCLFFVSLMLFIILLLGNIKTYLTFYHQIEAIVFS